MKTPMILVIIYEFNTRYESLSNANFANSQVYALPGIWYKQRDFKTDQLIHIGYLNLAPFCSPLQL